MTQATGEGVAVRPFRVDVPEEDLVDLRRRIAATRWPDRETVPDRLQGAKLAELQELVRYWGTEYDWRKAEAQLNAWPQFITTIDGVDVHFFHVRSRHENALPLIISHGWPGSVFEQIKVIGPLTDPTAYGGRAEDAFHVVIPSLPGFGFSGEPTELGWNVGRVAQAWAQLMDRLGYTRYVAQGGDVGAAVTDAMGRQAPEGLVGIHINLLVTVLAGPQPSESEQERAEPAGNLTRDHIVDNIMLYWLTGTGDSAARSYWEDGQALAQARASGQAPPEVSLPVGFSTFPGEIWRTPRSWAEKAYPNLTYFNEVDKGGHFAAWEEPELFATEVREAFTSLR